MLRAVRCAAFLAAAFLAGAAPGLTSRDAVVIPMFRSANPAISHFGILCRSAIGDGRDILVALGGLRTLSEGDDPYRGPFVFGKQIWLGVFLQRHGTPGETRQVAMIAGDGSEEGIEVEQVNAEAAVFLRTPVERLPVTLKLFFDIRSGKLI